MHRPISSPLTVIAILVGAVFTSFAHAQSALDIMKKVDATGYTKTTRTEMVQKVVTPAGDTRDFKMLSYSKNGSEKGLTVYVAPNQVRGMKILTLNDGDDIWTYFPKTNRTRKIASSARNRRVQGSDFTYDDMAVGKMAKQWQGTLKGQEKIAGVACFKLQITPTPAGPKSYSKAIAWVDKSAYVTLRVEYYDLDGDKLKRLDIGDYRKVSGVLVPHRYTMTNLTDGGKTMMKATKVAVNVDLDNGLFSEAGLSK